MREEEKDITTITEGIIAHGVNCKRKMGAGVAKAISDKWPIVKQTYMRTTPKLGKVYIVHITEQLWVMNCYTQETYGRVPGHKYASVDVVEHCLKHVARMATQSGLPVYIPRIGCGLGGLDWDFDLVPMIEDIEEQFGIEFTVCIYGE